MRSVLFGIFLLISWQSSSANQCTSSGRFTNDAVSDCRGYSMCIEDGAGSFIQYNLTCPPNFVFNPLEYVCTNVSNFKCLNLTFPYHCHGVGTFENPDSDGCYTYIACIASLGGVYSPKLIDCPSTLVYNPVEKICVNQSQYLCPVRDELETLHPQGNGGTTVVAPSIMGICAAITFRWL